MNETAVITGAGSGVGRAVALKLAREGWRLALVGRRAAALEETAQLSDAPDGRCRIFPCDVGDASAVAAMSRQVARAFDRVDVLVYAAGVNAPRRALDVLSLDDYHAMMNTNLNGAYYCVQAFLPAMRARQEGTIVAIVSEAGRQASSKAGPAYVVSKFGLAGLTQSINAEERVRGIRACAIFPGDIDTPLLDQRPVPPDAAARAQMLQPDDVAECVWLCIMLPPRVVVEEMLVRPR
jgi:NADP-dependent 3-hydroxy acid dehydrogenase YdfG